MTYTIRQLSKLFNLPASTLRYYEELGLLSNIERVGKKRIYQQCHIHRLKTICCFKESGMSLSQLKLFLEMENHPEKGEELLHLLKSHGENLNKQIIKLIENRNHILRKLQFYEAKQQAYLNNKPEPVWIDFKENKIGYKDIFPYK